MRINDIIKKYDLEYKAFERFIVEYDIKYRNTLGGWDILEDTESVVSRFKQFAVDEAAALEKKRIEEADAKEKARIDKEEQDKLEAEIKEKHIALAEEERNRVRELLKQKKVTDFPVFEVEGCRGRSIKVYKDRCIIKTDVTLGAILTDNATDGEKTIFYKDIIGIQYKASGILLGYLQLETGSNQMNNLKSNMFSENTFTFDKNFELVEEIKEYITYQVSLFKQL